MATTKAAAPGAGKLIQSAGIASIATAISSASVVGRCPAHVGNLGRQLSAVPSRGCYYSTAASLASRQASSNAVIGRRSGSQGVNGASGARYARLTRAGAHPRTLAAAWPGDARRGYASSSSSSSSSTESTAAEGNSSKTSKEDAPADSGEQTLVQKMVEAAATSMASIAMLGLGFALAGYGYHKFYKHLVLKKMELAFEPGDPVLELAAIGRGMPEHLSVIGPLDDDDGNYWIDRPEQKAVDAIVTGEEVGHYHLFIGEKGTGKSSMLLEAMAKIDAEGVAMFDAHADLEIFRIRLGKALNFEYNEDYIGGYFSEKGPRESTALLDIERALNKLEKVALKRRNQKGAHHPLIIIVNQMHLIRDDDDGRDLIELLQQRAEQWAAAGLVTMVFNSDDYWVYERFKQLAARLEVHSIQDLSREQAMVTLRRYRQRYFGEHVTERDASAVYDRVGGRLSFLNRVARSSNMLATCDEITETEKTWLLNQCWVLGAEMDDDVMDQQKWAAAAMVLAQALVDKENELREAAEAAGKSEPTDHQLPSFALHEAQQIMTRADFVREMDRKNLFTITSRARVRAASVPMMEAMRQICSVPGFRDYLDATNQRIADIESLERTRELVAKDLVLGGRYEVSAKKDKKEIGFRGWSPHERPARDPPEPEEKKG